MAKRAFATAHPLPKISLPYRVTISGRPLVLDAVRPSEAEAASNFVATEFINDEPLMGPLFSHSELSQMNLHALATTTPNLSVVIKDEKKIVGAVICDRAPKQPSVFPSFLESEKYAPFLALLKWCESQYLDYRKQSQYTGETMRVLVAATNSSYRGLGKVLICASARLALENGFEKGMSMCSNTFSENLFASWARVISTIEYNAFTYGKSKPYANLDAEFTKRVNAKIGLEKYRSAAPRITIYDGDLINAYRAYSHLP